MSYNRCCTVYMHSKIFTAWHTSTHFSDQVVWKILYSYQKKSDKMKAEYFLGLVSHNTWVFLQTSKSALCFRGHVSSPCQRPVTFSDRFLFFSGNNCFAQWFLTGHPSPLEGGAGLSCSQPRGGGSEHTRARGAGPWGATAARGGRDQGQRPATCRDVSWHDMT